jgi:hypothetical protein
MSVAASGPLTTFGGATYYACYYYADCYVRTTSGGAWSKIGTIFTQVNQASAGTYSATFTGTVNFGGTIGQHAATEFGIHPTSGTITAFGGVSYPTQTTTVVGSASPSGQKCICTVIPYNG